MHSRKHLLALACTLVALGGCASGLNPAPTAHEVAGPAEGAIERARGFTMVARAGVWDGMPRDLEQRLTPMLVTLKNDGRVPVRISYDQLMLVTPQQRVYKALPPLQIDGQVTQSVTPLWRPTGFAYAPYWAPAVAGAQAYPGVFPSDPVYWSRYGQALRKIELPSRDMLQRALPEGVLQPGGRITGFVYFPGVGDDIERVKLRGDFIDATSGERYVRLTIPFEVGLT